MVQLFQQSAEAQVGEAQAIVARSCDSIGAAYRFYTTGWKDGDLSLEDARLRTDLTTVVLTALRTKPGIEGGLWQADAGSLAYAFPTYEGSGPKTDLPAAERSRIQAINQTATAEERFAAARVDAASQTLLIAACPLPGPIPGLSAWAMTRVHAFAGATYQKLAIGLVVLFATVLGASLMSLAMILSWSLHVAAIEQALNAHDIAELPALALTAERELDRIVFALNEAGRRLEAARSGAEHLSRQVATAERLAAIGRVAAGVAHEIRNPIAAMRLKAEMAGQASVERKDQALQVVIAQVDRLDQLIRRLLTVSERDTPQPSVIKLEPFLEAIRSSHADFSAAKGIAIVTDIAVPNAVFDPEQMRRALDNLILNALDVAPPGSRVYLRVSRHEHRLRFAVSDAGGGPPDAISGILFEPFVTGRTNGSGLGLSIVREIAAAHGGFARFDVKDGTTTFEIDIPWQTF